MEETNKNMSLSGFFNHVFNFETETKGHFMNLLQYIILALIPVVILLKGIKYYIPESDENKNNYEIIFEVLLQLLVLFGAVWIIDRAIRYIPTYSGIPYFKFNPTNNVLPMLIVLFTLQTKMGAKINILFDRTLNLINGQTEAMQNVTNKNGIKVSQPIVTQGQHQMSQADRMDATMIAPPVNQMPPHTNTTLIDGLPNLSGMNVNNHHGNGLTTFQNQAIQNSFMESMEPMAANDALGGAFGSNF